MHQKITILEKKGKELIYKFSYILLLNLKKNNID